MRHFRHRAGYLAALVAPAVLAGCAGAASGDSAAEPTASAAATAAASPTPSPSGTAPASPSATPLTSAAPVDWDSGGAGSPQMAQGLPSPVDWYAAAFGGRTDDKVIYLTFDDGPAADTPALLDLLSAAGAKATFFVLGEQAEAQPELLRRLAAEGHAIANHSWNHPELTSLSPAEVTSELARTTAAVNAATPAKMGACMRPPYGLVDSEVAAVALKQNLQPILWTGHAEDWNQPPVAAMVADLQAGTAPGAVILLHDGGGPRTNTLAAVEQMLPEWQAQGYTLAAIPRCLRSST